MINTKNIFIHALVLMLVVAAFFLGRNYISPPPPPSSFPFFEHRQANISGDNKLINPLLECDDIENISDKKVNDIRAKVENFMAKDTKETSDFISVYFRDLNNGPWFGIHEKENFTPGSLLKVPLLISFLKLAESRPEIINEKVLYEKAPADEIIQYYKSSKEIEPGKEYLVKDLLEAMIKYSDNNAAFLLAKVITAKELEDSYTDLGIDKPQDEKYILPVKTYASFFRILYNATYLDKATSELALELLSQTDFNAGLRTGVPVNIAVAHKFGEYELGTGGGKQLHDCGIIYYPDKPYLLCVMTRGNDFDHLAGVIKNISAIVYGDISKE
jgi:beta-lactamase class A